jgi:hypothetical protein
MEQRETYMENVEAQMKEWGAQLNDLKVMAENNYLQEIESLDERYSMLKQKVEELKSADDETWEKLTGELQGIMLEFKNTIGSALTKIK